MANLFVRARYPARQRLDLSHSWPGLEVHSKGVDCGTVKVVALVRRNSSRVAAIYRSERRTRVRILGSAISTEGSPSTQSTRYYFAGEGR